MTNLPEWWCDFLALIGELPDRTSPDDTPEVMLATRTELESCALAAMTKTSESYGDSPLRCSIEGEHLIIRIGIDRLAYSAENCERLYDYNFHDGPPYIKVVDNRAFASDVVRALCREAENGSTPVGDLMDDAIVDAYEDGSEGVKYPKRKVKR